MPAIKVDNSEIEAKLILFDIDGTLVDDVDRYHSLGKIRFKLIKKYEGKEAAVKWANYLGVQPENLTIDMKGPISKAPRNEDIAIGAASLYRRGVPYSRAKEKIESIYEEADEVQKSTYKPRLFDGVEEVIAALKKTGFVLGAATNGQSKISRELLRELGLLNMLDVVVGADLVQNSKPSPDMILEACKLVNIAPSQAVYVGDQYTDILAGLRANVKAVIGIGDEVRDSDADFVVNSLMEISLKER